MKIDMHCHVHEGSVDSRVSMDEYIAALKKRGIDGMLVTDHDTYNGYRYWKETHNGIQESDFVVLKGIEYDTRDAGHVLVIMPQGVKMRVLELRGLKAATLINFVHHHGGILGPAHPYGGKFLSFAKTSCGRKHPEIMEKFDFVETFNACEDAESNASARALAMKYGKPGTGGSDAHRPDCIGLAYTIFDQEIRSELDLIQAIRQKRGISCDGEFYTGTNRQRLGRFEIILCYLFWFYNKGGSILRRKKRGVKIRNEQPLDPIDPIDIPYVKDINRKH